MYQFISNNFIHFKWISIRAISFLGSFAVIFMVTPDWFIEYTVFTQFLILTASLITGGLNGLFIENLSEKEAMPLSFLIKNSKFFLLTVLFFSIIFFLIQSYEYSYFEIFFTTLFFSIKVFFSTALRRNYSDSYVIFMNDVLYILLIILFILIGQNIIQTLMFSSIFIVILNIVLSKRNGNFFSNLYQKSSFRQFATQTLTYGFASASYTLIVFIAYFLLRDEQIIDLRIAFMFSIPLMWGVNSIKSYAIREKNKIKKTKRNINNYLILSFLYLIFSLIGLFFLQSFNIGAFEKYNFFQSAFSLTIISIGLIFNINYLNIWGEEFYEAIVGKNKIYFMFVNLFTVLLFLIIFNLEFNFFIKTIFIGLCPVFLAVSAVNIENFFRNRISV